ncbi:cupin domain-containing protein [Enterobacteriaceae bacterium Kacie_13]|nr:cupin domain-containing protein [Enterobacteriaceae bacterium Kacie_13]
MQNNVFTDFPYKAVNRQAETFELLLTQPGTRIERIISTGQSSPPDFWYCQPQNEWVMVLQGSAGLLLQDETETRVMKAGDFMNIPAFCKHRVEWTDAEETTIWLAVHYGEENAEDEAGTCD